jgi:hypothetical protein
MPLSISIYCYLGAIAFLLLYLVSRWLRAFGAWTKREQGPRERVGFFVSLSLALGAIAGGMLHAPIEQARACSASGQQVVTCMLRNP